jgi:hypothetical protein
MQIEERATEKAKQVTAAAAGGRCGRHADSSATRPEMAPRSSARKYNSTTDLSRGQSPQQSRLEYFLIRARITMILKDFMPSTCTLIHILHFCASSH